MNYDQIQFVIVLYNVDIEESETFQSFVMPLLKFGCSLFIYDNSPIRQTSKILADTKEIVYVHDAHNSGLSKAYNVAAAHARNNNKKYLLLLDQDTLFPESSLNIYIDAFRLVCEKNTSGHVYVRELATSLVDQVEVQNDPKEVLEDVLNVVKEKLSTKTVNKPIKKRTSRKKTVEEKVEQAVSEEVVHEELPQEQFDQEEIVLVDPLEVKEEKEVTIKSIPHIKLEYSVSDDSLLDDEEESKGGEQ